MRALIVLALIGLAACAPPAPSSSQGAPAQPPMAEAQPVLVDEPRACADRGGEWRAICRLQKPACVTTFTDADKACSDGADCAGDCIAHLGDAPTPPGAPATGVCAANDDPCGCKQKIEGGKAGATICVD